MKVSKDGDKIMVSIVRDIETAVHSVSKLLLRLHWFDLLLYNVLYNNKSNNRWSLSNIHLFIPNLSHAALANSSHDVGK